MSTTARATASTNITSSPLAVTAASAANRWRLPVDKEPSTNRHQAKGRPETRAAGASLLCLRLKPKAAAAPNSGRGTGADDAGATLAQVIAVSV